MAARRILHRGNLLACKHLLTHVFACWRHLNSCRQVRRTSRPKAHPGQRLSTCRKLAARCAIATRVLSQAKGRGARTSQIMSAKLLPKPELPVLLNLLRSFVLRSAVEGNSPPFLLLFLCCQLGVVCSLFLLTYRKNLSGRLLCLKVVKRCLGRSSIWLISPAKTETLMLISENFPAWPSLRFPCA